jgi:hypothetical protein
VVGGGACVVDPCTVAVEVEVEIRDRVVKGEVDAGDWPAVRLERVKKSLSAVQVAPKTGVLKGRGRAAARESLGSLKVSLAQTPVPPAQTLSSSVAPSQSLSTLSQVSGEPARGVASQARLPWLSQTREPLTRQAPWPAEQASPTPVTPSSTRLLQSLSRLSHSSGAPG